MEKEMPFSRHTSRRKIIVTSSQAAEKAVNIRAFSRVTMVKQHRHLSSPIVTGNPTFDA